MGVNKFLLLLSVSLGSVVSAAPQQLAVDNFTVCGKAVKLEMARTNRERAVGLMERDELPVGHGMVFVFDHPENLAFWMKNVPFDIEIGYFDPKGVLVSHLLMKGTSPLMREETLPRYESGKPAQYAVELPVGFFASVKTKGCKLAPLAKLTK